MTLAALFADAHARADGLGPWLFDLISGKNQFWQYKWLTKEHFEHLVRKLAILRWVDRLLSR